MTWRLVKLAVLASVSVSAFGQTGGLPASDSDMRIQRDIRFAVVDDSNLELDLYMPEGVDNPPLVVWIFGGGWRVRMDTDDVLKFIPHGFAVARIDYRLSPVAAFPAQIHDIKAAIRFLRANAQQYGYDGSRIITAGSSAGAHLAALAAVTNGSAAHEGSLGDYPNVSSDVQALVSYFGASNLTSILDQSTPFGLNVRVPALELLFGGPAEDNEELARLASPVFYVNENSPPMFLLHGDQDPQMPINQTHELHGAAKQAGVDVVFDVVHGARHGGDAFYTPERITAVAQFLHAALAD